MRLTGTPWYQQSFKDQGSILDLWRPFWLLSPVKKLIGWHFPFFYMEQIWPLSLVYPQDLVSYAYIFVSNSFSFPKTLGEICFGLYCSLYSQVQTSHRLYSVQLSLPRASDWRSWLTAHLHGFLASTSISTCWKWGLPLLSAPLSPGLALQSSMNLQDLCTALTARTIASGAKGRRKEKGWWKTVTLRRTSPRPQRQGREKEVD